jgi:putative membrane protein
VTDRVQFGAPAASSGRRFASGRLRAGLVLALAVGLGLVTLLVGVVGLRKVVHAVAAIGWLGFAIFCAYWLLVMSVAGLAWAAAAPRARGRAVDFVWARFLRDSAAEVLPFSQLGGLVVGARAVMAAGVAEHAALASTIVDMTAEIAAQFFYTLLGVGLIAVRLNAGLAGPLMWPALGGLALLFVAAAATLLGQRRVVAAVGRLGQRWLPNSMARAGAVSEAVEAIYRQPARIAAAVGLHLVGWVGGAGASWIALKFMGAEVPFWAVVAVESLMYALRNLGFALPAGLGVQEVSYVLLGPLFGVHASEALALSLLRRARDLVIGVPVLLIWQAREGRSLLRRRAAAAESFKRAVRELHDREALDAPTFVAPPIRARAIATAEAAGFRPARAEKTGDEAVRATPDRVES